MSFLLSVLLFNLLLVGNGSQAGQAQAGIPPTGTYQDRDCLQCHRKLQASLVTDWQHSAHGRGVRPAGCTTCHGTSHESALDRARRDDSCVSCHGGPKAPVIHSYATSKHGLILRLEAAQQGWSRPLRGANYRTPGCAYCHMHGGQHDVGRGIRKDILDDTDRQVVQDEVRQVCQDCHAPRYVTRLFNNGEKMLEIGRMKLREAQAIIDQASQRFDAGKLLGVRQQLAKMRQHLQNIYLGIVHQSPDYQWWHGQPAMDGDLLRIKGRIDELQRIQAIADRQAEKMVDAMSRPGAQ